MKRIIPLMRGRLLIPRSSVVAGPTRRRRMYRSSSTLPSLGTGKKSLSRLSRSRTLTQFSSSTTVTDRQQTGGPNTAPQQQPPPEVNEELDVLIVGGGLVGSALAVQLMKLNLPYALRIGMVDAAPAAAPKAVPPPNRIPNPRSYALSPNSLEVLGLLPEENKGTETEEKLIPSPSSPFLGLYDSMQLWEAHQPASLVLTSHDVEESASSSSPELLGAVVEHQVIQDELNRQLQESRQSGNSELQVWNNTKVTDIQLPTSSSQDLVQVELQPNSDVATAASDAETSLSKDSSSSSASTDRRVIKTRLLVGADGANSYVRQATNIPLAWQHVYPDEKAWTCTVRVSPSPPFQRRAFQRFCGEAGILAVLPTYDPHHVVIVWSTKDVTDKPDDAANDKDAEQQWLLQHWNELLQTGPQPLPPLVSSSSSNSRLLSEVDQLLQTVPYAASMLQLLLNPQERGSSVAQQPSSPSSAFVAPPWLESIESPVFKFPLRSQYVQYSTTPTTPGQQRVVLIGDAAHTVHPMAGQGLNIGLQHDVRQLTACIDKAVRAGMDVAAYTDDYHASSRLNVPATVLGIHALHQLFLKDNAIPAADNPVGWTLQYLKSLGMSALQNLPPLKQVMVQMARQGIVSTPTSRAQ